MKGFTLIEILIFMCIIGIISLMSNDFMRFKFSMLKFNKDVSAIYDLLKNARNYSLYKGVNVYLTKIDSNENCLGFSYLKSCNCLDSCSILASRIILSGNLISNLKDSFYFSNKFSTYGQGTIIYEYENKKVKFILNNQARIRYCFLDVRINNYEKC